MPYFYYPIAVLEKLPYLTAEDAILLRNLFASEEQVIRIKQDGIRWYFWGASTPGNLAFTLKIYTHGNAFNITDREGSELIAHETPGMETKFSTLYAIDSTRIVLLRTQVGMNRDNWLLPFKNVVEVNEAVQMMGPTNQGLASDYDKPQKVSLAFALSLLPNQLSIEEAVIATQCAHSLYVCIRKGGEYFLLMSDGLCLSPLMVLTLENLDARDRYQ